MKIGKIVLKVLKSIPIRVFLGAYFRFFLIIKISIHGFYLIICLKELFFNYRKNVSTKMNGYLWNFCFMAKLSVLMSQSVRRHLAFTNFGF